jgi:hypothetical protein
MARRLFVIKEWWHQIARFSRFLVPKFCLVCVQRQGRGLNQSLGQRPRIAEGAIQ